MAERDAMAGREVGVILCGGNIDMNVLTTVIMRGLSQTGRYLRIETVLADRPGALEALLTDPEAPRRPVQPRRIPRRTDRGRRDRRAERSVRRRR